MEQELMEAQERLIGKRKMQATEMGSPIRSISLLPNRAESGFQRTREYDERIADETQKARDMEDAARIERPERWLHKYGVSRKHLACSFENFTGGEAVKKLCCSFPGNSILLSGKTGCGKTHLAVATLRHLVQRDLVPRAQADESWNWAYAKKDDALFITVPELLMQIRASYGPGKDTEIEIVSRFGQIPVLVIDDLGADKTTEWAAGTLYLILDRRNREMMPTFITTNLTMDEIHAQYGARIASRLADMKVVTINMPDYRKKRGE